MTTQKIDYLDDFLGEFEVDNEFSGFGPKSNSASTNLNGNNAPSDQKQTNNDWSIPFGEINEDVQSLSEEENNEAVSNDVEEPAKNGTNNNAEADDQDDAQPVIKNVSNNTWSGVKFEQSKLSSVYDKVSTEKVQPEASTGVYSAYKPKEQSKFTSQALQGGGFDFPAIGEALKEIEPKPVVQKVFEPKPVVSSYSSAMPSYQPKSTPDYAKALQNVTISQNKPVEPATADKKEQVPAQTGYQPGSYRPKAFASASKTTQPAVSAAPPATFAATDGAYKPKGTYASKFKK